MIRDYKDVYDTINQRKTELVRDLYDFEHSKMDVTRRSHAALKHAENTIRLDELNKLLDTFHTTLKQTVEGDK